MAGELDAAPSHRRRPGDHVDRRPVVTLEVHIDGGEAAHAVTQVASQVERLHEHLGQHDRRPEVQVDAALELPHHGGEEAEVAQAALADGGSVGGGVHVHDVGPDGDVHGDRHARSRRRREDAGTPVWQTGGLDGITDGAAEPEPGGHSLARGAVQELAGLARHSEEPAVEPGTGVLGGPAAPRHLEVVHETGAVHRHGGEPAALDQVDDRRAQPDLDGVRAHAEHDRAAPADRRRDATGCVPQVARGEDVRQAVEKAPQGEASPHGSAERRGGDLARTPAERHGANAGRVDGRRRAGDQPAPGHTDYPQTRRSTSSHSTWPARMWVSWMRGESVLAETRRLTSTMPASAPPSPPVSPIVWTPIDRQADTARSTLGDWPPVERASATSPAGGSASTWRAKTSSEP